MNWNRHRKPAEAEEIAEEAKPEEMTGFEKAIKETAEKVATPAAQKAEDPAPAIKAEKLEEIRPVIVKKRPVKKKRVDKKTHNNVGIVGNTIEVKDFRAIVKRKGEQINTVLTKLINDYNRKNYNL